jgi:alpha-tubulin suppressor-like RCC1 family protein
LVTGVSAGEATFSAIGGGTSAGGFIRVTTNFTPLAFSTIGSVGNHLCGLEAPSGRAFCWGDNHAGALGNPSLDASEIPGPVSGDRRFSSLSVGDYATCTIEKETGSAYCWGANTSGDLGDGTVQTRWQPTPVASGAIRFSDISANGSHTCAVEAKNGLGYCWGKGSLIGDGTTGQRLTPTLVGDNARRIHFTSISAGSFHSCGIEAGTGTAYCWGQNNLGEVGDGTVIDRLLPVPVGPELSFSTLSAGPALTCGVEATTKAGYCWGTNSFGQIGDGTTINRQTPTRVAGGRRFSSISATGSAHACGIEIDTELAYCWGRYVSQVTTSPATNGSIPAVVGRAMRFKSIVATYAGGCGVEAQTGRGYCWTNAQLTPVPVLPPSALSLGVGGSR